MEKALSRNNEPWKAFEVRQRTPALKREVLLKTAAHLFLEHGYRKTSMNDIADHLNVTKPALYHYFQNKEEILVSCYEQGIARIEAPLDDLSSHSGTGLDKVRAFIHAYVDVLVRIEFALCVAALDDRELTPATRSKVRKLKRRLDSTLRQFVVEGIEDGSVENCEPKLVAFAIGGALNWIGRWYSPGGQAQPKVIIESYTDYLVRGLAKRSLPFRHEEPRKPKARGKRSGPSGDFQVAKSAR
jgi:AcrR family transcriptional regulator